MNALELAVEDCWSKSNLHSVKKVQYLKYTEQQFANVKAQCFGIAFLHLRPPTDADEKGKMEHSNKKDWLAFFEHTVKTNVSLQVQTLPRKSMIIKHACLKDYDEKGATEEAKTNMTCWNTL